MNYSIMKQNLHWLGRKKISVKFLKNSDNYSHFLFWLRHILLNIKDWFSKQILFSFETMFLTEIQCYHRINHTIPRPIWKDKSEEVMVDMCKMKKVQIYGFWGFLFWLGTIFKRYIFCWVGKVTDKKSRYAWYRFRNNYLN